MSSDKTRAERIEELLRDAQEILADYLPGFSEIQNSIEMTLAMPPDPPRGDDRALLKDAIAYYETMMRSREFTENARATGAQFVIDTVRHIIRGDDLPERDQSATPPRGDGWEALRELRTWVEREIDPADRQQSVLDEIDRLLAAAPKEPEPAESPSFDMIAHLRRQREWSERTFGPGSRAAGVVDHIRKELDEIAAAPGDLEEWIDVVILALDGAWRSGATPEAIVAQLVAKQTKNEGREWPDWRTSDPNSAIQHVKPAESPAEPAQDDESLLHKANDCLSRVCEGQRFKLTATVPARPGVDDDLVLRDGIEAGLRLAREKADLRAEVERLRAFRQRPDRLLQHDHSPGATYANCIRCVADERDAFEAKLAAAESYIHDLNELLNSAVGRAVDAEARIAEMRAVAWSYPTFDSVGARTALRRIAELGKGGA